MAKKESKNKGSGKYLIVHDRDGCIGCAACVVICEKYWKMDSDGKATLIGGKKKGKNYELEISGIECNQDAASSCPVEVIKVVKL